MKNFKKFGLWTLFVIFSLAFFSCSTGVDQLDEDTIVLEDDDDSGSGMDDDPPSPDDDFFDDDTDDDSSDDDSTDDDSDDDDFAGDDIKITKPVEAEVINGSVVSAEFTFGFALTDIHATLDDQDVTALMTMVDQEGWGVVSNVEPGSHTFTLSATYPDKSQVSDSVNFTTRREGPYLELTLSSYTAASGDTITASWIFYDENLNDATSQVSVSLFADNGAQVNGDQITLINAGVTNVSVSCSYDGFNYDDSQTVHVGDYTPPIIQITSPDRGLFTTTSNIYVTGKLIDASPIDFLKIKSIKEPESAWQVVSTDQFGHFSQLFYPVDGLNTIQLWAKDVAGNESYGNVSILSGQYNPDDQDLQNCLGLRINQSGLDSIAETLEALLNGMDFTQFLPANPVVDEDYVVFTLLIEVNHSSLSIGQIDIDLTSPASGQISLAGTIGAIAVDVRIYGDIFKDGSKGIPYSLTIPVTASGASISADLDLNIANGVLLASLSNLNVNVNNLYIGILPDFLDIFNDLISEAIEDLFLEDFLEDTIEEMADPLILDAINELNQALNQQISLLGFDFDFALDFESMSTDSDGVSFWTTVKVESANPSGTVNPQPGSYKTYSTAPVMGANVPGTSTPYGFGIVLDDDLLNQALYEAYQSGIMSLRIDQQTAPFLGFNFNWRTSDIFLQLLLPQLSTIHQDAPLAIQLRPQIMPVLVFDTAKSKDSELNAEIQLGDFLFDLIVVHPVDGDVTALTLALALYMPVTIGVNSQQNTISITFAQEIQTEIQLVEEAVDFNDSAFEDLVPMVLEFALPLLGGILDDFPIPSFSGYTLLVDSLITTGNQEDWLGLYGSLSAVD